MISSRRFQEGELKYGFGLNLSGLIAYREELCVAYDSATPGKPLLMYSFLMTIYRAIAFFGRFFSFISGNEPLSIKLLITDTHQRIPAGRMITMCNHFEPYYGAGELPHPKIRANFEIPRDEISGAPSDVFSKVIRQLFELMKIKIPDDQAISELGKITTLK